MNGREDQLALRATRRQFLRASALSVGGMALSHLLNPEPCQAESPVMHAPKAKRIIYLFQSGGPPQQETFDYKPHLEKVHGQETPASVLNGQRLTGMTSGQTSFPVASSAFKFQQHG